jgi:hypothetical protein
MQRDTAQMIATYMSSPDLKERCRGAETMALRLITDTCR